MLTMEALNAVGADTASGLARCMNNEAFYLKMVRMCLGDDRYEKLPEVIANGDIDQAFEYAHALKGTLGNVSLTNLLRPVEEITELARSKKTEGYDDLLAKMQEEYAKLKALL